MSTTRKLLRSLLEFPRFCQGSHSVVLALILPIGLLLAANAAWAQSPLAQRKASNNGSGASHQQSDARLWTDSTGQFQVNAILLQVNDDSAQLQKLDRPLNDAPRRITVPIARLSAADQAYLKALATPIIERPAASSQPTSKRPSTGWLADISKSVRAGTEWVDPKRLRHWTAKVDMTGILPEQPLPADMIYIQLSKSLADQVFNRPVAKNSVVRDTIVGNPVSGRALTQGQTSVNFSPSRDQAVLNLLFAGQTHSTTTTNGGLVRVHSNSRTDFSATKRLVLDAQGLHSLPTIASARTTIATTGLSTDLPRLRGRVARRIASGRVAESHGQAQNESARSAERRIAREFDTEVHQSLDQAGAAVTKLMTRIPQAELAGVRPHFSCSTGYVQVAFVRGSNGALADTLPPAPSSLGTPDVAVHVHSSVVQRVMADPELRRAVEPLVQMLMTDRMRKAIGEVGYSTTESVELQQSDDGAWWSAVVRQVNVPRP